MTIKFVVPGKPFGKKSVRTTRQGWSYMPKENTEYKKKVIEEYTKVYKGFKFEGKTPLYVEIIARFCPPASMSKKIKQEMLEGVIKPTVKPDSDNIVKMVLDSLNDVCFEDDKQVVIHTCKKVYAETEEVSVLISDEVRID